MLTNPTSPYTHCHYCPASRQYPKSKKVSRRDIALLMGFEPVPVQFSPVWLPNIIDIWLQKWNTSSTVVYETCHTLHGRAEPTWKRRIVLLRECCNIVAVISFWIEVITGRPSGRLWEALWIHRIHSQSAVMLAYLRIFYQAFLKACQPTSHVGGGIAHAGWPGHRGHCEKICQNISTIWF